eukprot:gene2899-5721_t
MSDECKDCLISPQGGRPYSSAQITSGYNTSFGKYLQQQQQRRPHQLQRNHRKKIFHGYKISNKQITTNNQTQTAEEDLQRKLIFTTLASEIKKSALFHPSKRSGDIKKFQSQHVQPNPHEVVPNRTDETKVRHPPKFSVDKLPYKTLPLRFELPLNSNILLNLHQHVNQNRQQDDDTRRIPNDNIEPELTEKHSKPTEQHGATNICRQCSNFNDVTESCNTDGSSFDNNSFRVVIEQEISSPACWQSKTYATIDEQERTQDTTNRLDDGASSGHVNDPQFNPFRCSRIVQHCKCSGDNPILSHHIHNIPSLKEEADGNHFDECGLENERNHNVKQCNKDGSNCEKTEIETNESNVDKSSCISEFTSITNGSNGSSDDEQENSIKDKDARASLQRNDDDDDDEDDDDEDDDDVAEQNETDFIFIPKDNNASLLCGDEKIGYAAFQARHQRNSMTSHGPETCFPEYCHCLKLVLPCLLYLDGQGVFGRFSRCASIDIVDTFRVAIGIRTVEDIRVCLINNVYHSMPYFVRDIRRLLAAAYRNVEHKSDKFTILEKFATAINIAFFNKKFDPMYELLLLLRTKSSKCSPHMQRKPCEMATQHESFAETSLQRSSKRLSAQKQQKKVKVGITGTTHRQVIGAVEVTDQADTFPRHYLTRKEIKHIESDS